MFSMVDAFALGGMVSIAQHRIRAIQAHCPYTLHIVKYVYFHTSVCLIAPTVAVAEVFTIALQVVLIVTLPVALIGTLRYCASGWKLPKGWKFWVLMGILRPMKVVGNLAMIYVW